MTRPALELRPGQHLTLTPQLQQSIRLLQLSSLELEAELSQALAENPLLERDEDPAREEQADPEREASVEADEAPDTELRLDEMPGSGGVLPTTTATCRRRRARIPCANTCWGSWR